MTILEPETRDLPTPGGPMRTAVFRPTGPGRFPGLVLFSEIFQLTGPIRRTAALLASHGYVVAVPEIFHEHEAPGTVLPYDETGADRGNWCKVNKTVAAYDADARAVIAFLETHPACSGQIGSLGICIGGHLSFRCAMNAPVLAGVCFYATDLHKLDSHVRGLGTGMADDSLERVKRGDLRAEMLMIWGRQDPHIPFAGRAQIHATLEDAGANYQWLEVNGAHAFLRDEGPRYNAVLAGQCLGLALELFHRRLSGPEAGASGAPGGSSETKH